MTLLWNQCIHKIILYRKNMATIMKVVDNNTVACTNIHIKAAPWDDINFGFTSALK